jgi:hypothetical protein
MAMPVLTAALAGVPAGIQSQGPWQGRRQLFVRFAGEAETATMYRAAAAAREVDRILSRSRFHSLAVSGRDAMGNSDFLAAMLGAITTRVLVMIDTDGEHPEAVSAVRPWLTLLQVSFELTVDPRPNERALESLRIASTLGCEHALVIIVRDDASDAQLLRIVEQAHSASAKTMIVIHPGPPAERTTLDRRWGTLLEHAANVHNDVRIGFRLPGPAALR